MIYGPQPLVGGGLDGALLPNGAYSLRGGRMLTTDHYECTWNLLSSTPSLEDSGHSVREETIAFNQETPAHSQARLVDRNRFKIDVTHMGLSARDRLELLRLAEASEETLGNSRITDWLSPGFFESNFWYMWQTTFAFQPWHSALELKRYLHRFMNESRGSRPSPASSARSTISMTRSCGRSPTGRSSRACNSCAARLSPT
nr:oleate hydratase [Bradyrhizobium sp. CCBAU 53380]